MSDEKKSEKSLRFLAALGVPGCEKKASEEEFNKLAAAFAMLGGPVVNEELAAKLEVPKMVLLGEEVAFQMFSSLKELDYKVEYQKYEKDKDHISACRLAAELILGREDNTVAIFLTEDTVITTNKSPRRLELQVTKIKGLDVTKMKWTSAVASPYMYFDLPADEPGWQAHLEEAVGMAYIRLLH